MMEHPYAPRHSCCDEGFLLQEKRRHPKIYKGFISKITHPSQTEFGIAGENPGSPHVFPPQRQSRRGKKSFISNITGLGENCTQEATAQYTT